MVIKTIGINKFMQQRLTWVRNRRPALKGGRQEESAPQHLRRPAKVLGGKPSTCYSLKPKKYSDQDRNSHLKCCPKLKSIFLWISQCNYMGRNNKDFKKFLSIRESWNRENCLKEHYAEWNKPGDEGWIPYDLTVTWNLINKRKKQTKYNQRHWS